MGAGIELRTAREQGGEPVADLLVRGSRLRGVEVPAGRGPSMSDEYAGLPVASAFAEGRPVSTGLAEPSAQAEERLVVLDEGLATGGARGAGERDRKKGRRWG